VAKKLTILDALAPTFIPRKAKYVPILDRHVLSKVFDDVSIYVPILDRHVLSKVFDYVSIYVPILDKHVVSKVFDDVSIL
jgi:hypothetical protein